jgi:hypothetical protein
MHATVLSSNTDATRKSASAERVLPDSATTARAAHTACDGGAGVPVRLQLRGSFGALEWRRSKAPAPQE